MSSLLVKKNIVNMETLSADTIETVTWSHVGWSVAELVCHSHKRTELTAGGHKKKDKKRKERKKVLVGAVLFSLICSVFQFPDWFFCRPNIYLHIYVKVD